MQYIVKCFGCFIAPIAVMALMFWATSGESSPKSPNRFVSTTPAALKCGFGREARSQVSSGKCQPRTHTVQPGDTLSEIAEMFGDANQWNKLCVTRLHGNVTIISMSGYIDPLALLPGSTVTLCP